MNPINFDSKNIVLLKRFMFYFLFFRMHSNYLKIIAKTQLTFITPTWILIEREIFRSDSNRDLRRINFSRNFSFEITNWIWLHWDGMLIWYLLLSWPILPLPLKVILCPCFIMLSSVLLLISGFSLNLQISEKLFGLISISTYLRTLN